MIKLIEVKGKDVQKSIKESTMEPIILIVEFEYCWIKLTTVESKLIFV